MWDAPVDDTALSKCVYLCPSTCHKGPKVAPSMISKSYKWKQKREKDEEEKISGALERAWNEWDQKHMLTEGSPDCLAVGAPGT